MGKFMKLDIEMANTVKEELLSHYKGVLESVTLVLGDKGFRIQVVKKPGVLLKHQYASLGGIDIFWS